MAGLPEGFSIDAAPAQPASGLPEGFTVDRAETWNPATWKPAEGPAAFITDVPREAATATESALTGVKEGLSPSQHQIQPWDPNKGVGANIAEQAGQQWGRFKKAGSGLGSAVSAPFAPFVGAARSILGHPLAEGVGATRRLFGEPDKGPEKTYEEAKEGVDLAMMGLRAGAPRAPVAVPPRPAVPEFGVNLSRGQETGELSAIQREQAALRGQHGEPSQRRAQEFADQQRTQLEQAHEDVTRALDPAGGGLLAESPAEAGAMVSEAVRGEAAQRRAGVNRAYETAREQPGEIHAGAFEDIGQRIKGDLSLRDEPVIIDDLLTPHASRAIRDIDDRVARLRIQNRADPFGEPNPENIVGVDLRGVDQMRRRLSAFRRSAYESGNAADGRAARAVIDSFDRHVDEAINSGLFTGNPSAVQAWNDARAAHHDYRSTFSAGKNDPIGRVIEKITGRANNPAAIPNDVADFLYGSSGVNPNSLNVGVATRVRNILGDQSPEWAAVKQGLFSRVSNAGEGMADMGPGRAAQRLNRFLNVDGRELANVLYSPAERGLLQDYANLLRRIQVPQAGANWSNTATFAQRSLNYIGGKIGMLLGATIGGALGHGAGLPFIGETAGAGVGAAVARATGALGERSQLRQVARQMPLVAEAIQQWQRAVRAANRANASPMSRTALAAASANLAQALERIGIRGQFPSMQMPVPSRAEENNQNIPWPPNKQKRGGRVEQKPIISHLPLAKRLVART
jgi:hypothetical protein